MSRPAAVRLVIAALIVVGSVLIAVDSTPRLGLDLRGGTQIVLETQDSPTVEADAEATDRTLEVLRGRVDALGVAEPTLARSGERRIIVELPGLQDPREAAEVIGRTAQLTFHPVVAVPQNPEAEPARGNRIVEDEDGFPLEVGPPVIEGEMVSGAAAANDPAQATGWYVTVDFRGEGRRAWRDLTAEAACAPPGDPARRIAIVLDENVISSPQVVESIQCGVGIPGGSTQITGDFSAEEARELSVLIEGGALPVPVEIIEQRTVGPTLGAAAIDASFKAGVIGLILTGLFIAFVYRVMGVLATVALACYTLIAYAALVSLGATLTLPGLAGFVLAIGMAIDANVLVFERAREEYIGQERIALRTALATGFNKAWSAIIDSNVTTLLAASLLFFLASGPVKGFGVTLTIGVLASMISALIIARVLTEQAAALRAVGRRAKITGLASTGQVRSWLATHNPNIMGRRKLWLTVSAVALVVAMAGIGFRGLNLGVEFTGGRLMEYSTGQQVTADQARAAVSDAGFANAVVQESDENKITVRTGNITNDEQVEIEEAIADIAGGATKERDELIGPSLGSELRNKALIAFGVALLAQMLYLGVRFKWTFGASAVAAMFHDVILVVGIFAWLGKPIDGVFLAAALTIIGLSVNDSVVVFDRVREQWSLSRGRRPFSDVCNDAVIQTLPRTVNTGLGAMFILGALAILGGDSLKDFAIALLLGLVIGSYSSIFTATPLAVMMHAKWPTEVPEPKEKRRERHPSDTGAVV